MATLTTTARGSVRADHRHHARRITISVGSEAFLVVSPGEARELAEALLDSASAIEEGATPSALIARRQPHETARTGGAA
ncbi:hypothetical protein [Stenotrophomonas sp. ATCM1_4]|uniref:hypothetical protein n=1 Tax=Stenotrophomonas sp. ATCM1_4 TaxID=2259330 RepID=UPI001043B7E8|nr:hypothetical protein [Stenotrophomonas sp. ATCM1_4]